MLEKPIQAIPLTPEEQQLLQLVDDNQQELIALLSNLVEIDSRVYDPETYIDQTPIIDFASKYMQSIGCKNEIFECPHPFSKQNNTENWHNLISVLDSGKEGKKIQFIGHLDVVPFYEEGWDPDKKPLKPIILDGKMYGRGTADMKGGIAGQMMAIKIFKEAKIPFTGKIQMYFTPDEEMDGPYGARFMAKNHNHVINADASIISEPTGQSPIENPAIIVGEKGCQWFRLGIHGSAGHGSMPKPKSNAINKANNIISQIKRLKLPQVKPPMTLKDMLKGLLSRFTVSNLIKAVSAPGEGKPDPYNDDGIGIGSFFKTTISFNQIKAGTKVNVIPDYCELEVDIRVLPGLTTQEVFNSIAHYCTKLGYRIEFPETFTNLQHQNKKIQKRPVDIELNIIAAAPGTFVDPHQPFTQLMAQTFEQIYKVKSVFFFAPGSSDATHLREKGIKNVVLFGPPGGNTHDANEYVLVDQVIKACKMYLLTLYRFFREA
jgi:succinyl-diaminopimelate desuccinylase